LWPKRSYSMLDLVSTETGDHLWVGKPPQYVISHPGQLSLLSSPPQLFYGPFSRWAGARKELWDFMMQGKINRGRHTDHPDGRHSIRTSTAHQLREALRYAHIAAQCVTVQWFSHAMELYISCYNCIIVNLSWLYSKCHYQYSDKTRYHQEKMSLILYAHLVLCSGQHFQIDDQLHVCTSKQRNQSRSV